MTHLVFGTGLIGGYIAGGLMSADIDTALVGRNKHIDAMRDGLILTDLNGNRTHLPPPFFWHQSTPTKYDVIWLTVKCTAIESCVEQLRQFIKPESVLICCQNGLGSDSLIRKAFPDHAVLNAVVGFNVAEHGPAHLHRSTDGSLVIKSFGALTETFKQLNSALLPVHVVDDILVEQWAKLQLNLANPVNALSDIPTKAMTEDAHYRKVIAALMSELLAVTDAMNLSLPKLTALPANWLPRVMRLPNWIYLKLAQKTLAIDPTARVSMWWDLSQGKSSEIDFLNQAVVEQGRIMGIECPLNSRIVKLIKQVENGETEIGISGPDLVQKMQMT